MLRKNPFLTRSWYVYETSGQLLWTESFFGLDRVHQQETNPPILLARTCFGNKSDISVFKPYFLQFPSERYSSSNKMWSRQPHPTSPPFGGTSDKSIYRSPAIINRLPNLPHRSTEASWVTTPMRVAPATTRRTSSTTEKQMDQWSLNNVNLLYRYPKLYCWYATN